MRYQPQTKVAQANPDRPATPRSHTTADATVALAAASLAALAWASYRAAGIVLEVRSGSGTSDVNVVSVVITVLVVAIAGAGLLRVLERRTTRARRVWTILAAVVLALSLLGPLSATRPSAGLALAGLHLLVGGVVIAGLRMTHAPSRTARRDGA